MLRPEIFFGVEAVEVAAVVVVFWVWISAMSFSPREGLFPNSNRQLRVIIDPIGAILFRPFGACPIVFAYPRLAPWAAFLRRVAAVDPASMLLRTLIAKELGELLIQALPDSALPCPTRKEWKA